MLNKNIIKQHIDGDRKRNFIMIKRNVKNYKEEIKKYDIEWDALKKQRYGYDNSSRIIIKNIIKQHIDGKWDDGDIIYVYHFREYWIFTKWGWVELHFVPNILYPKYAVCVYEIMERLYNKRYIKYINRHKRKR